MSSLTLGRVHMTVKVLDDKVEYRPKESPGKMQVVSCLWDNPQAFSACCCLKEGVMSATYPTFEFDKEEWNSPLRCKGHSSFFWPFLLLKYWNPLFWNKLVSNWRIWGRWVTFWFFWGLVGTADDGMVIEYEEVSSSTTTTKGGEGAVPEGGFKHPHTKRHGWKGLGRRQGPWKSNAIRPWKKLTQSNNRVIAWYNLFWSSQGVKVPNKRWYVWSSESLTESEVQNHESDGTWVKAQRRQRLSQNS